MSYVREIVNPRQIRGSIDYYRKENLCMGPKVKIAVLSLFKDKDNLEMHRI